MFKPWMPRLHILGNTINCLLRRTDQAAFRVDVRLPIAKVKADIHAGLDLRWITVALLASAAQPPEPVSDAWWRQIRHIEAIGKSRGDIGRTDLAAATHPPTSMTGSAVSVSRPHHVCRSIYQ